MKPQQWEAIPIWIRMTVINKTFYPWRWECDPVVTAAESKFEAPFLPLNHHVSVVNSCTVCTSVHPSVKQGHTYLYLIRSSSCQASLTDADSPLLSGMQDFTSGKYKSLPLRQDTSTTPFVKTVVHLQANVVTPDWVKDLFILLAVLKDSELNLTQTSEISSSLKLIML